MRKYSDTTDITLITFHIGRGGRFWNPGHKSYVDQDMAINSYTDDLFVEDEVYIDASGSQVGLDVDNDGTGIIDIDGDHDTTIVKRLKDCSDEELLLIYNSNRYKSSNVEDYCKSRLLEVNMIFEDEVEEDN